MQLEAKAGVGCDLNKTQCEICSTADSVANSGPSFEEIVTENIQIRVACEVRALEYEGRLRRLEAENHLLKQINHSLSARLGELESEVYCLRAQVLSLELQQVTHDRAKRLLFSRRLELDRSLYHGQDLVAQLREGVAGLREKFKSLF